jgi:Tol biopolymer transport system component
MNRSIVRFIFCVAAAVLVATPVGAFRRARPIGNAYPAWSPDGRKIAFQSTRTGDNELFVMNIDGTDVTRLTDNSGYDVHASWTPDSRRIVFASNRSQGQSTAGRLHLYVMDANGQHPTRITNDAGEDSFPEVSRDGRRIVFINDRTGKREAYIVNIDGSNLTPLTTLLPRRRTEVGNPHWSPDGGRIVFDADLGGTYDIYSVRVDGSDLQQLTHSPAASGSVFWAAYSPAGTELVYERGDTDNWRMFAMKADGSASTQISPDGPGDDFHPSWSPDGSRLTFSSDRAQKGVFDIWIVNRDGSGLTRLTHGAQ